MKITFKKWQISNRLNSIKTKKHIKSKQAWGWEWGWIWVIPDHNIWYPRASSSDSYPIISEAQSSKSKREAIGFLSLCYTFINSSFSMGLKCWWGSRAFPFPSLCSLPFLLLSTRKSICRTVVWKNLLSLQICLTLTDYVSGLKSLHHGITLKNKITHSLCI